MANILKQDLIIGNITLKSWEVPENITKFFGVQKVAVHDFPGFPIGKRTIQNLGSFPFPDIEWTGQLFDEDIATGTKAMDRATALNSLRVQGTEVTLTYGQFNMSGTVCEFEITAKMPQWLEYHIRFIPRIDNTTSSTGANSPTSADANFNSANSRFDSAASSPASGVTLI